MPALAPDRTGRNVTPTEWQAVLADVAAGPLAVAPDRGQRLFDMLATGARGAAGPLAAAPGKTAPKARSVGFVGVYGYLFHKENFLTELGYGTSTDTLAARVDALASDPSVETILVEFDTPGGSVYGTEQAALAFAAAAKKKRLVSVVNCVAASGGYWLASNAGELVLTHEAEVGSIGVFITHVDVSRALDAAGQKVTLVRSGRLKAASNPYGPLSADGAAELQRGADEYHEMFLTAVARGRGVSRDRVRTDFGEGGMVRARAAVGRGMADRVEGFGDAVNRAMYGTGGGAKAVAVSTDPEVAKRQAKLWDAAEVDRHREKLRAEDRAAQMRASLDADKLAMAAAVAPAPAPAGPPALILPAHLRRRVSVHEAGHAVVAHILGDLSAAATIVPNATSYGRVTHAGVIDGPGSAVLALAGAVAEELYATDEPGACLSDGDDATFLCSFPVGFRAEARQKAHRFLGGAVHAVRHVAAALEAHGTVTAADVASVMKAHPPHHRY